LAGFLGLFPEPVFVSKSSFKFDHEGSKVVAGGVSSILADKRDSLDFDASVDSFMGSEREVGHEKTFEFAVGVVSISVLEELQGGNKGSLFSL
jgi:hypothetical protein